jgi:FMN phosphatase YigB (HAD superfamily)
VIERGEHHQRALEIVRPGIDIARERAARSAAGVPDVFDPADMYPDALPCLLALRAQGYRTGVAANISSLDILARLELPVDVVASSAEWGVEKPNPKFFERLVRVAQLPPQQIAYVGDRLDNDILPAIAAGMTAVFIRRGPWGCLHALRPEAARAHLRIDTLAALPDALRRWQLG